MRKAFLLLVGASWIGVACGHGATGHVGLMSFGDLQGKVIPQRVSGPTLRGKDCAQIAGDRYSLSEAARNALKDTGFDTLVDVRVETTTGLLVVSNCVEVIGAALDSASLQPAGEAP